VRWQRASYAAVHDFLTNPAYAGAFAFGRTRAETTISPDGEITQRRRTVPLEQWSVLIREHHPGYVTWDSYLDTQRRLQANLRTRGEGGGAAREGKALLQGIIRCGRCGRRMQIAYSGTGGKILRYACARGRDFHATDEVCQSLAGRRLDRAVADAFLEAVTPAALRAGGEAVAALEREHEQRRRSQQLAVERAEQDAVRAQRQFDACEPENRLVGRTLEQRLETALATLERERSKLAEVEQRRPQALSDHERTNLAQLARELPRLWDAPSTSDRQRKELLRTIIGEVIVTVHEQPRRADAEIRWEGGARSHLTVTLTRRGAQPTRTAEDTVELIRRLAEHHPDPQIALILNRQGRRTGTGLRFTASRVAHVRGKEKIPPAPPPASDNELHTVEQAARELGVSQGTIYRWLRSGLLGGEQLTPGAPWRIRISDEVRSRFVPDIPDGYVPLDEAAKRLGIARQTVLHKVQRGELHAVQVTSGQRKGLRIAAPTAELGLLDNQ
jgi:excisionase family DNA binding protein